MQMVLKRACSRSFTSYDDTPISILGANHARATNHPPSAAVPAGRRSRCVRTLRSLRLITEERRSHMRDAEIPLADRLRQLPVGERPRVLSGVLRDRISEAIGLDPPDVGPRDRLMDLGVNSMKAVELQMAFERELALPLPAGCCGRRPLDAAPGGPSGSPTPSRRAHCPPARRSSRPRA